MGEYTIDELQSRVGETNESVTGFRVEAGKVAEFARGIGDDNPAFRDKATARSQGYHTIPAPATFTRVSMFPRYRPSDGHRLGFDIGFDIEREIHGEQSYEFERPVYVGDMLHGTTTLMDAFQREGERGGTMTFATLETEYRDADDGLVVTEESTIIETEGAIEEGDADPAEETVEPQFDGADVAQPAPGYDERRYVEDVQPDDSFELTVRDLTRPDFVRYAGASGDFNPIHYDEQYAHSLGNPRVFGQGMLTMGYAGHLVSDWLGLDTIRRFETRFLARVWPGDTVVVRGRVQDVKGDRTVSADLAVDHANGESLLSGTVTAVLPSQAAAEERGK